jgi:hypothetical protein
MFVLIVVAYDNEETDGRRKAWSLDVQKLEKAAATESFN